MIYALRGLLHSNSFSYSIFKTALSKKAMLYANITLTQKITLLWAFLPNSFSIEK